MFDIEDEEFWALTQPMVVNVADTRKDRMRNRPEMCFFQVIAGVFISLIRESLRCFRESGCMSFSGWRSLLCLSSSGSLADLPGYPYPAYYGPLSILRPRTAVPRHLLSRAAGLWTQTNATPGRGLFRTSAPQGTLLINSLFSIFITPNHTTACMRQRYKKCYHTHEKCFFVVET